MLEQPVTLSWLSAPKNWRKSAKCRGRTKVMFSKELTDRIVAKTLCNSCPVQKICLGEALVLGYNNSEDGIWGGKNPKERRKLAAFMNAASFRPKSFHDSITLTAAHG